MIHFVRVCVCVCVCVSVSLCLCVSVRVSVSLCVRAYSVYINASINFIFGHLFTTWYIDISSIISYEKVVSPFQARILSFLSHVLPN